MAEKLRVLFLCTGNSCRSQMAEGWAKALKADYVAMLDSGMLRDDPPQFDKLLERIAVLQEQCNALARNNA